MKRKGTNMEDNRIIECIERANYILGNLMAVTEKDEVLIVIDDQTDRRMANAMAGAAKSLGAEYGIYQMPVRGKDQATIFPKSLELGMDACTVFVGMTTGSGAAIYNNHLKELINQKKLREVSICLQPQPQKRPQVHRLQRGFQFGKHIRRNIGRALNEPACLRDDALRDIEHGHDDIECV